MDSITWKFFYDNIRGYVVFKRISDFNGLYMNKNVYNTVKILRTIMLRIKANENIC